MVFACHSRGHNLSLALLICGGYSWFTYRPGGSLLLFCISWSLSSLFWNVTDMGLVWFGLYLPTLVQYVILVFSAILLLRTRSSSLIFVCADVMVSITLCFVASYGSHCCSGIPVKMTLLHSWVDSICDIQSLGSSFSLRSNLFSFNTAAISRLFLVTDFSISAVASLVFLDNVSSSF